MDKSPKCMAIPWWGPDETEAGWSTICFNVAVWTSMGIRSVQSLSHVWLFAKPWIAACQVSLSISNSQSLLKFMSIEWVMPSNHLILCRPLLLPPISPSIRVFSNESTLPSHEVAKVLEFQLQHQSFQWTRRTDLYDGLVGSPCSPRGSQESSPTSQLKSINFFGTQLSSWSNSHIHTWPPEKP